MNGLKRGCVFGIALTGLFFAQHARAQFGYLRPQTNPFGRPTVSPYVNLDRGGSPAIHYDGLIRPQLQTYQSLPVLEQQPILLQQQHLPPANATVQPPLSTSGHRSCFFNYSHYYPMMRIVPATGGAIGQ